MHQLQPLDDGLLGFSESHAVLLYWLGHSPNHIAVSFHGAVPSTTHLGVGEEEVGGVLASIALRADLEGQK